MADTLESLEIQVKHSATGAADEINKVAQAINNVNKALVKVLPNLRAFKSQMMVGASLNITDNSTTNIAGTVNNIKEAANGAKKATADASKGISAMAKSAQKANSPLENFVSSLKRIAFYRMIRGIIKAITQAFSEGLQVAYLFSAGITGEGNRFAAAMDKMKASTNAMKGQLGSAFISLLAAIQPILISIINLVTKAADAIAQFFAAFTGKTYLKATETSAKFADNMKAGGAAAKEWKNQLLGFDEINRLNEPSGGGGGGGSNPLEGFDFDESPISEKIQRLVDKIKTAIEWIKEHLDLVKSLVEGIGTAILAYKIVSFLSTLFGLKPTAATAWALLAAGIFLVVDGLIKWIQTGTLSADVAAELGLGILAVGAAISLMSGSWIPLLIAGIVALILNFDSVKKKLEEWHEKLKYSLDDGKLTWADFAYATVGALLEIIHAIEWVINAVSTLIGWLHALDTWLDGVGEKLGANGRAAQVQADGSIYLQGFASGGFPSEGQLFVANEAGAEMVGSIGGRTAVATNDDIVEAVRQGVYDAVLAANNNGGNNTSFKLYLDSREIKYGLKQVDRAWG